MSNVHNMVHIVQQTVQDYNDTDNSNTLLNLQASRKTVGMFDGMWVHSSTIIILEDPNKNQIQVSIERKNAKIYFTRGWSRLRNFYSIGLGGWVTLLYMNPFLFHMKVWKITGIEVTYPRNTPPYKLMLLEQSSDGFSNGHVPYFVSPRTFCHTAEKTLTSTDVESGVLKLCWNGFCEVALPNEEAEVTILDWFGYTWKFRLELEEHSRRTCQIVGQWRSICKARKLMEGVTLKLGVTKPSNNTVVHLKISPFIGVRTTLIAPTTSGSP